MAQPKKKLSKFEKSVTADNSEPKSAHTEAMDDANYRARLHIAKKVVRKAESKISSYTANDVEIIDKTEYAAKLGNISAKVEAATDVLDDYFGC